MKLGERPPAPEPAICECQHCSGKIQFDPAELSDENNKVECPHCAMETTLIPPLAPAALEEPQPEPVSKRAIDLCSNPGQRRLFIVTTTGNEVSGQAIEKYLGIARGVVVRSPTSTQSLFGGLEKIIGGNIEAYGKLCEQARQDAFSRMVDHANTMQADAIIAFRYDATEFSPGVTEVLAYGTAVKLRPIE
jgi:uncharacterized protein YbjQ (UPF0145 family)